MFSGVTGGMIFSQEELQSWVTKNMPTLLRQGLQFNRAVYNEMFLALDASRDDLIAIIPADADNAEDLIHQIFYMNESSQHTVASSLRALKCSLPTQVFPPGRAVTESRISLFKMPRVWRDLIHAWDSTFRLAPVSMEIRPNVSAVLPCMEPETGTMYGSRNSYLAWITKRLWGANGR